MNSIFICVSSGTNRPPVTLFKDKTALELDRLDIKVTGRMMEADRLRSILFVRIFWLFRTSCIHRDPFSSHAKVQHHPPEPREQS